jgi:hypothetical protein
MATRPDEPGDEIREYVEENEDLLSRVLRHGDTEARSYALALLANGGTDDDIEAVCRELQNLQNGGE